LLFVPGNKTNMLEKALGVRPDAFVPDMEDSVPDAEKGNARRMIQSFLPKYADAGGLLTPRVNALDTEWFEEDLAAVVGPHVDGICIGKVDTADDLRWLDRRIGELE